MSKDASTRADRAGDAGRVTSRSAGADEAGRTASASPNADEVRQRFLDYFAARDHAVVPSSSLIPRDDPTLLFTNAGMNQFKEVFLGHERRRYSRSASSQKCMRVSGKHNDLENVGPSTYHHTFFEMLGNFSFGDYFKEGAIEMAWDLLTAGYGLPQERLWASVYEEDDEAHELWRRVVGIDESRLVRLGADENFWAMGDTGPCGPCSEIHFDWGVEHGCGEPDCGPACDCGRFVEIWNLVFMQFNRDESGETAPLPSPNIDTGAGLERLTAVLQGARSNYDTDLFRPLIDPVAAKVGLTYGDDEATDVALRVIGDHGRAVAFLLADGVSPANEGRGYVLRRLIRRAVRFGMKAGFEEPFLHGAAELAVERMGEVYPELQQGRELIRRVTRAEEERFFQTLSSGVRRFEELVDELRADGRQQIPGDEAFRLYDTYGLPIELTREFADDHDLTVDEAAFQKAMESQRQRARAAWKGAGRGVPKELLAELAEAVEASEFVGYEALELGGSRVLALIENERTTKRLEAGAEGGMIVDRTPFYAEAGGQVGDQGVVVGPGVKARVSDVQRLPGSIFLHRVVVEDGALESGASVDLRVDVERRRPTMRNHTATHLLHAALRERLGEHVRQAGSLVAPDRLRFDFAHFRPVDGEEVVALERQVNEAIRSDLPVEVAEMGYSDAIERGALAFFGDKYGDRVRVITVPGVSMELCGGTHVRRTGEIGAFLVTREESVAAGTRRIEALTGAAAVEEAQRQRRLVRQLMAELQVGEDELRKQVESLLARLKTAEREAEALKVKLASQRAGAAFEEAGVEVDGVRVVTREVEDLDPGGMRDLADQLKSRLGSGIVVLGIRRDGKAQLVVGVTKDLAPRLSAATLVRSLARMVGGGGGGHAELAEAGGPDGGRLHEALEKAPELVSDLLSRPSRGSG